jgi:hypothetical protein
MTQEQLRMQMLAGIITESQYKEKLNEEDGNFKGLNFGKLSTLFQILSKTPSKVEYIDYNEDTDEETSGTESIVSRKFLTPDFFKKLKALQDGFQRGDKEAGTKFTESFNSDERFFPFNIYDGEKDLFMPADYRVLDDINKKFDEMFSMAPYTSKYENNNMNIALSDWNNLVDTINNVNLDNFKKYIK